MNTPSLPSLLTLEGLAVGIHGRIQMFLTDVFIFFLFFRGEGGHSIQQIKSGCHKKKLQELVSQGHWVPGLCQEAVARHVCIKTGFAFHPPCLLFPHT